MAADPEPHAAEITDMFATEPPAAFHILVSFFFFRFPDARIMLRYVMVCS